MPIKLLAFILVATLTTKGSAKAEEPEKNNQSKPTAEDHAEPAKAAREAMESLRTNGVKGFMDVAFSDNKISFKKAERAGCESYFRNLHGSVVAKLGKPLNEIELVRTDVLGRSGVRFIYVEKLERSFLLWCLSFYRGADNEWKWNGLNVKNNQLDSEFRPTQPDERHKKAAAIAKSGVDAVKANDIPKLLDAVFDSGKTVFTSDRSFAELSLTSNYQKAIAQLGKPCGEMELVRTEAIGQSLVRFVYLEKCEGGAAVWKFSFYCAGGEWKWQDYSLGEWASEFVDK
ncbi:MAG TPA: hypothetical protein VG097_05625 [Gemmata sp.]|jgi:hypothetical protein|nr:hypothetical protein [Gemmata sp.]